MCQVMLPITDGKLLIDFTALVSILPFVYLVV